jgi:hypothetical protein
MTVEDAKKWESIAKMYEKTFALYVSLRGKIQNNAVPFIDDVVKEALSNVDLTRSFPTNIQNKDKVFKSDSIPEHVHQIRENINEVWDNVDKKTEIYQEMKLDAYKTAGQMYEEIGDLENAAKMYSYSYDHCMDKSVEINSKIQSNIGKKMEELK